jgi:hypothetical protein
MPCQYSSRRPQHGSNISFFRTTPGVLARLAALAATMPDCVRGSKRWTWLWSGGRGSRASCRRRASSVLLLGALSGTEAGILSARAHGCRNHLITVGSLAAREMVNSQGKMTSTKRLNFLQTLETIYYPWSAVEDSFSVSCSTSRQAHSRLACRACSAFAESNYRLCSGRSTVSSLPHY